MRSRFLMGAAIAALLASSAFAADNTTGKDASGATVNLRCKDTNGSGLLACTHTLADSTGAIIDPPTKQQIDTLNTAIATLNGKIDTLNGNSVAPLAAGEGHIGEVSGKTIIAGATFTTPAGTTAYALGQLIANSSTAASVVPMQFTVCRVAGGTGMIRRARAKTTDTGFAGVSERLHLYRDDPSASTGISNGDHAAFLTKEANEIGIIDMNLDRHFSDYEKGTGAPTVGSEMNFDCAPGTSVIYGLLEGRGSIVPVGAKVHTFVLEVLAN